MEKTTDRNKSVKPLILQLANRIVEHVRLQALPEGRHLAEQALADAFNVSRSPVREALILLEREHLVTFHPNRGFFLALPATNIRDLSLETPVFAEEEKYFQIAEDRIQGKLYGHVSEAELMSRYGISRVKLMKILVRMSQEGWVERRPGHGWNFLPILDSVEALDQGYRFRLLVEPAALLEPTYRVDPVLFAGLRKEQEALDQKPIDEKLSFEMFETGARFHEQIVSCSGNRFFLEAVRHVNRLRRLIEYKVEVTENRVLRYREHMEILTLLEENRVTNASDLLREHLLKARSKLHSVNL
jgi:DNA-binding GntR family transcriptional regulator